MPSDPRRRSTLRVLTAAALAAAIGVTAVALPAAAASRPSVVSRGPTDRNVVALTIDDCWNEPTMRAMLAILARERVNATFFPAGRAEAAHPEVWKAVAAAGFPIANHTYSHAYLTRMSTAAIVADLRRNTALIERVSGVPIVPLLRPPMGEWKSEAYRAASITGQAAIVVWTVVSGDTGRGTAEDFAASGAKGGPGAIVLLHANRMTSATALDLIIASYRARGFGFVTVPELLGMDAAMRYPAFTVPVRTPERRVPWPRCWWLVLPL